MSGLFAVIAAALILPAAASAKENKVRLRLCIFGDTQSGYPSRASSKGTPHWYLKKLYEKANELGVDGYIMTGDLSDYNNPVIYDEFRAFFEQSIKDPKNPPAWLPVMGNHDFWGNYNDKNYPDRYGHQVKTREERKAVFMKHLKIDTLHPHIVLNGYDIIGYSVEGGMDFNQQAVDYVENEIKKAIARDANKPIIVFAHDHCGNTLRGSGRNHNLYNMFAKYPQVIYFSGHTHRPLEDEMTIHQKDFTSVGTGTIFYTSAEYEHFLLPYSGRGNGKNMIYMTIDDEKIVLRRFQLRDNSEILDNGKPWTLQLPLKKETFTYDPAKRPKTAPVFPENAAMTAKLLYGKNKEFTGVQISGTAATHPNCVRYYEINIYEKVGENDWKYVPPVASGKQVKYKMKLIGDYYQGLNFQKKTFTGNIFVNAGHRMGCAWEAGKTYRIDLRAMDAFDIPSAKTLSTTITIPKQ